MNNFREIVLENEYKDYLYSISLLENYEGLINENILTSLSPKIRKIIKFIKDIADNTNQSLSELLKLFKNSKVYNFFKIINFSFNYLFKILKKGFNNYKKLEHLIFNYLHTLNSVKSIKEKMKLLDEFLISHPLIKKMGGVGVSAILIYIWLNMSYTPDLEYSMSWEDMITTLSGNYSIEELFGSEAGIKMLTLFATGVLTGLTFPWPGPQSAHIAGGLVLGLYKIIRK